MKNIADEEINWGEFFMTELNGQIDSDSASQELDTQKCRKHEKGQTPIMGYYICKFCGEDLEAI